MVIFFLSLIPLMLIVVLARFVKRKSRLLQKYSIPSSLLAGLLGLILGPQVLKFLPPEVMSIWAVLPKYLIIVVFAELFLGKVILKGRGVWKVAGPQIAFGNVLAWGQYLVGSVLCVFVLIPFLQVNPKIAALIEISFEGGHGTVAGLAPTFASLGFSEGTDIAIALATVSIFTAVFFGMIIINLFRKKFGTVPVLSDTKTQELAGIKNGYNLNHIGKKIVNKPRAVIINILGFASASITGLLLLNALVFIENVLLTSFTTIRFFPYVPLFPLAMIGGLLVQLALKKVGREKIINRRMAEVTSAVALDILITSAIATLSLSTVSNNFFVIATLAIAGIIWIIFSFFFIAPKVFPNFWFEKGLADIGQSMGTTATGLMLLRQVDPGNKSKAKEGFALKQLVFEPFMGGGLITASSIIIIHNFGIWTLFTISLLATIFWLWLGFSLKRSLPK